MIVKEEKENFLMITQHDHAKISGEIAEHWKKEYFIGEDLFEEVVLAVTEHDRGWILLDNNLLWNIKKDQPYSFMDYPLKEKLKAYTKGIQEVEAISSYGALLCSLHYCSFVNNQTEDEIIKAFLVSEKARQIKIAENLRVVQSTIDFHYRLLQFCDNLSLYICLNKHGVSKEEEISWYKNGFPQQFTFLQNDEKIIAHWVAENEISFTPFILNQRFEVKMPYKRVSKDLINELGLQEAYIQTHKESKLISIS